MRFKPGSTGRQQSQKKGGIELYKRATASKQSGFHKSEEQVLGKQNRGALLGKTYSPVGGQHPEIRPDMPRSDWLDMTCQDTFGDDDRHYVPWMLAAAQATCKTQKGTPSTNSRAPYPHLSPKRIPQRDPVS